MHYVYLLMSESQPEQRYVGTTNDLRARFAQHNAGESPHTSKFRPWRLVTYVAFSTLGSAARFEQFLKTGSGHAFAKKRLWGSEVDPVERFQKLVCFSETMKKELRLKQSDLCEVCGMPLWKRRVVVHHMDYGHSCGWEGTVFVKAGGRNLEVPDCGECRRDDEGRFEGCRRRLALLHQGCHADYHAGRAAIRVTE